MSIDLESGGSGPKPDVAKESRRAASPSIQSELLEIAMDGSDPADSARLRAVDNGLGFDRVLPELYAFEQSPVGDASRDKCCVPGSQFRKIEFFLGVSHAHFCSTFDLGLGVEDEAALHLAPDTAQGAGRQHAFRRGANTKIKINAALGLGGENNADHVAVGDQTKPCPRSANGCDEVLMARAIHREDRDFARLHALGLGQGVDIILRARVEIDDPLRIARTNRNLVHVDIGSMEKRAAGSGRKNRNRAWHVLGAKRRALERIDGYINLGAELGADFLADEKHGSFVAFALADDNRAFDR